MLLVRDALINKLFGDTTEYNVLVTIDEHVQRTTADTSSYFRKQWREDQSAILGASLYNVHAVTIFVIIILFNWEIISRSASRSIQKPA